MATESDVVVGSKWRYNDDHPTPRLRGEVRTVTAVRANGYVDTEEFGRFTTYVDVLTRYATRIDQPPEKAGEDVPVPVGSKWQWKEGTGWCAGLRFSVVELKRDINDVHLVYADGWDGGWHDTGEVHAKATRLDTPQEAAPAAAERYCGTPHPDARAYRGCDAGPGHDGAHVAHLEDGTTLVWGALQQGEVTSEKNMRSLINSFRKDEGLKEVCLTSCGPATPCLASDMCRARDAREKRVAADMMGRNSDYYFEACADRVANAFRYAPPEPNTFGMGALACNWMTRQWR